MQRALRRVLTSKLFLIPLAAVLLYAMVGFLVLPALVRWYVPKLAKEKLGCVASIDTVRLNPFRLELDVTGFKLQDAEGVQVVAFERLFADLQAAGINHWMVKFREVRLEKPSLTVVFQRDGSTNVQKLFPASEERSEPSSEPIRTMLQNVTIQGGRLEIIDRRQTTAAELKVEELNLILKDISTVGNRNGTYSLSASTPEGEALEWEGDLSLSPLRSTGKVTLVNLRAKSIWEFARDRLNFRAPGGELNIGTDYRFDAGGAPLKLSLEGLRVAVSNLSLELIQSGKPSLNLKRAELQVPRFDLHSGEVGEGLRMDLSDLSVKAMENEKPSIELKKGELQVPRFDLRSRTIQEPSLLIDGGSATVRIDPSGAVNLMRIAAVKTPEGEKHPQGTPQSETIQGPVEAPAATPDQPFRISGGTIRMKGLAFSLEDASRPVPLMASLSDFELRFKTDMELGVKDNTISVKDAMFESKGVRFGAARSESPVFKAESLSIEGGELDLARRSAVVSRIAMSHGQADLVRDHEGRIDWLSLLGVESNGKSPSPHQSAPGGGRAPWKFMIRSIWLEHFRTALSDFTIAPEKALYDLREIQVELQDVDGKSPFGFTMNFRLEQGGSVNLRGRANPSDTSVETEVTVKDFPLLPLKPLLDPHVNLTLRSAAFSTQGKLGYALPGADAKLAYEGSLNLSRLAFSEPDSEKTYLGFDSMDIPRFKLSAEPNKFDAPEVVLSKPVGELIIAQDGSVNATKWVKGGAGTSGSKPAATVGTARGAAQEPFPFRVGKVRVENGNVVFADFSLRPNFMTRIQELKGTVMGVSSAANTQAKIQLDGRVDQYGQAKIGGELSLYDPKRSTEVDMVFRNVEMTALSPYSGKFAGRRIKSGRLSMDLKYKIKESRLAGENKIIVDNLILGERVESPDALNLPLDLAIALLQDSKGRIDIGLPVTGDLNNPEFSIAPLIWKGIVNVLKKAVTAPFRALGSMFAGEEKDFTSATFDPGKADLSPPEKEKLKKLADLIKKRPQVKLVVQGQYSLEADGMEFREVAVRRAVAAQQGKKLAAGEDPGPLDFGDSGTRDALEEIYRDRFGKADLDELRDGIRKGTIKVRMPESEQEEDGKGRKKGRLRGMVDRFKIYKAIPGGMSSDESAMLAAEMTARLVEKEPLTEETLRVLAQERAKVIMMEMETSNGIPANQLAAREPEPTASDAEPAVKLTLDAI